MAAKKTYAVFGLGRYGKAVALELIKNGFEVMAVDNNEAHVNAAIPDIPICKCADVTDKEVLKQLGIPHIDVVVIAMASSLESSVMATMLCKELGVKTVVVKCSSDMNCKILSKVGADQVVFPEHESGVRLGKSLISSGLVDIIELSKDVSMVEIEVKESWVGKNLMELNLRKKYSLNVVAIIQNEQINTFIDPTKPLTKDMTLVVIADANKLSKIK